MALPHFKCQLCDQRGYTRDEDSENAVFLCEQHYESLKDMFPIHGTTVDEKIHKMNLMLKRLELNEKLQKIKKIK